MGTILNVVADHKFLSSQWDRYLGRRTMIMVTDLLNNVPDQWW